MPACGSSILVIAFHFPPIAAAGTHRTLNFVRELAARGHRLAVVTTSTLAGQPLDHELAARVPRDVEVVRVPYVDPHRAAWRVQAFLSRRRGALPAQEQRGLCAPRPSSAWQGLKDLLTSLPATPDRCASWIPGVVLHGLLLGRRSGARVLYSTAPPFSAHVAAMLLRRLLDVPWVADFRDPWSSNPFREDPRGWLRRLDAALEEAVVRRADRVLLNTELAEDHYRRRFPAQHRFRTLPNGVASELLVEPGACAATPKAPGEPVRLLHAGTIYGPRWPRALVEALGLLRRDRPDVLARLVIEQLGDVENRQCLLERAAALGVGDRLRLFEVVPHRDALRRARHADVLLLLGPGGGRPDFQVPAKLFEYLAAGRPILALARAGGSIARTLACAGARHLLADPDDPESVCRALIRLVQEELGASGTVLPGGLDGFRYDRLAAELESELLAVQGPGNAGPALR